MTRRQEQFEPQIFTNNADQTKRVRDTELATLIISDLCLSE